MAFDPTKYGATPVDNFDPTKLGATPVLEPKKTASISDSIWNSLAGYGKNVANAVQQGGQAVNGAFSEQGSPIQRGFDASVAAAGSVLPVAASLIPGGTTALDTVGGIANKVGSPVVNALSDNPLIKGAAGHSSTDARGVSAYTPNTISIEGALKNAQGAGTIASTILAGQGAATTGNAVTDVASNVSKTSGAAKYVADAITPKPEPVATPSFKDPTLLKIQDLISPKANAKEIKLAIAEGRIAPGQEPTLLRDGTPDQILPSDKIVQASKTIRQQIPGSETMSQPELHGALDRKIEQISKKLKPEMQKVPLTDNIINNIHEAWNFIKQKQLDDPYTSTGANLEKLQSQFETKFLDPITNKTFTGDMSSAVGVEGAAPTMDNLWDVAKAYDESVPANVKNASAISTDTLQTQKSIWLQNRAILRNAITDAKTGLGKPSQQAFSDMHDMFNAQKGIQSSYKLPKEGEASGVKKFMESGTGKTLKTVAKVGVGVEAGKRILTGEF